ncbi:ATP-binding protein [Enterovibrio norvegicus]|uniref:ATP-binding protein n=1 Tax=Enterovibrio norvegicus TaxID=188144 RepID=UPI000C8504DB|nr:ATP-binding protein [Enterovibrio norvegicus]PMH65087.1 histidine kinase [Enterovibrio norvegicus]
MRSRVSYIGKLSLKSRLLLATVIWLTVMVSIAGVGIPVLVNDYLVDATKERLQLSMTEISTNLQLAEDQTLSLSQPLSDPRFQQRFSGLYWSISAGSQQLRSPSLAGKDFYEDVKGPLKEIHGARKETLITISDSWLPDSSQHPVKVMIGIDEDPTEDVLKSLTSKLWVILSMLFIGVLVLIGLQVAWSLLPLNDMQRELVALKEGKQDALSTNYPQEVSPLVSDLNALLFHYHELLSRARHHAGNLSHALKTPLSVLKNDILTLDEETQKKLLPSVTQIQTQIDYHLGRARVAGSMNILAVKSNPCERVDAITMAFDKVYASREIIVVNELDDALDVAVDPADLDEMLGNVLENGYKWATSLVRVYAVDAGKETVQLCIEDDGDGIPTEEMAHVLERSVRLDESVPGTGLGLNIVKEIAHSYRGKLDLCNGRMGGLKVVLTVKRAR